MAPFRGKAITWVIVVVVVYGNVMFFRDRFLNHIEESVATATRKLSLDEEIGMETFGRDKSVALVVVKSPD